MTNESESLTVPKSIVAFLFDMDGVLTQTAKVHAAAWKEMFDAYLKDRAESSGEEFVPFSIDKDYPPYVDGKLRQDGVRSFLASRGIDLPEGTPDDPADAETINGLGNRKNDLVQVLIQRDGVQTYPDTMDFLRRVRAAGARTAVVSASKNTPQVLDVTGLGTEFDVRVDGNVAQSLNLPGKPKPDTFLEAARELGLKPEQCAVLEDALSGVEAGRAGNFGLVIGVDRVGQADALRANGAGIVTSDVSKLTW